jgi:uncharacterized membrane protein
MSLIQLYLLTRADHIHDLLVVFGIIFFMAAFMVFIGRTMTGSEASDEEHMGVAAKLFAGFIVLLILSCAVPTKEDLYVMLGGYYATNDAELKKLPDNVLGAVNDFLTQYRGKTAAPDTQQKR